MAMNNKAQMIVLKLMLAIVILIMAVGFSQPLRENIDIATNTSANLNCSVSETLSTPNKAACVVMDFSLFYLIGAMIAVGMAFVAGRKDITGIITAIAVFIITTILIEPLKSILLIVRDADWLNCAATTSVGAKLTCIVFDIWLFWFIVVAISSAITYIFVKKVLPPQ